MNQPQQKGQNVKRIVMRYVVIPMCLLSLIYATFSDVRTSEGIKQADYQGIWPFKERFAILQCRGETHEPVVIVNGDTYPLRAPSGDPKEDITLVLTSPDVDYHLITERGEKLCAKAE